MSAQSDDLRFWLHSGQLPTLNDDLPDTSDLPPPNPIERFVADSIADNTSAGLTKLVADIERNAAKHFPAEYHKNHSIDAKNPWHNDTELRKSMRNGSSLEKRAQVHADGVETEVEGTATYKYHWANGKIIKTQCIDSDLPGGGFILDENGDEIAA